MNFFKDRLSSRPVSRGPLPSFIQPDPSIRQELWSRSAHPSHEFATIIDLVISHIDDSLRTDETYQMTRDNPTACVTAGQDISMLLVVKSNFIRYFTIIGVVDGAKNSVVIHGQ